MSVGFRNGKYFIRYRPEKRNGPQKRITLPAWVTTREDAEAWEAALMSGVKGEAVTDSFLVQSLFERYLVDHVKIYTRPATWTDVSGVYEQHIKRLLGSLMLDQVNDAAITLYIKTRKGEKSERKDGPVTNRTINKELSYLSGFFTWCIEKGHMVAADRPRFRRLPYTRPKPQILTFDEIAGLLAAADDVYQAFFSMLYGLGLRISEARRLVWSDLDLEKGTAIIKETKTEGRVVPLPAWLVRVLQGIRPRDAGGQDLVFVGERLGRPVNDVRRALERAAKKAGIERHITPHLLRHSFATHASALGINVFQVKDLMGHASIATTQFYTHLATEHLKGAQDLMNDRFEEAVLNRAPKEINKDGVLREKRAPKLR